jgi:very-short-patch-repair endonuclease
MLFKRIFTKSKLRFNFGKKFLCEKLVSQDFDYQSNLNSKIDLLTLKHIKNELLTDIDFDFLKNSKIEISILENNPIIALYDIENKFKSDPENSLNNLIEVIENLSINNFSEEQDEAILKLFRKIIFKINQEFYTNNTNKDLYLTFIENISNSVELKKSKYIAEIFNTIFSSFANANIINFQLFNPNDIDIYADIPLEIYEKGIFMKQTYFRDDFLTKVLNYLNNVFKNFPDYFKQDETFILNFIIIFEITLYKFISDREILWLVPTVDKIVSNLIARQGELAFKYYYFLLFNFIKIKNNPQMNPRVYPYTFLSFYKKFIMIKDILDTRNSNILYTFLYFFKNYTKPMVPFKLTFLTFSTSLIYLNEQMHKQPERVRNLSMDTLMQMIHIYSKVPLKPDQVLIDTLQERDIESLSLIDLTIYVTSIVMLECVNEKSFELFGRILNNPDLDDIPTHNKLKHYLNLGFYISQSLYDNIEVWDKWLTSMLKYKRIFNDYDSRMILEIIEYLKLIGPQYDRFDKFKANVKLEGGEIKRKGGYSKSTSGIGHFEHIVYNCLKRLGIKFKYQVVIDEIFSVDFVVGDNIIFNIHGIQHYYINDVFKETLKSRLRTEILKRRGYPLVELNLYLFRKIHHSNESKLAAEINELLRNNLTPDLYKTLFKH